MATVSRDVELSITAKTAGAEELTKLSTQLREMGEIAGEAKPKFDALAAEVDQLAKQQTAVQGLKALEAEIQQTSAALEVARARAATLGEVFSAQSAKTAEFKTNQEQARIAVAALESELKAAEAKLAEYREGSTRASRATDEYQTGLAQLKTRVREVKEQLEDTRGLVAQRSEVSAVDSALRKASSAYEQAQSAATKLEGALAGQTAKLETSVKSLEKVGVSATTLADAQKKVESSSETVTTAVVAQINAYERAKTEALALTAAQDKLDKELRDQQGLLQTQAALEEASAVAARQNAAASQQEAEAIRLRSQALRDQANVAKQALNEAFAVVGVRSAEQINAEIIKIRESLAQLAGNAKVSGQEFDRAFASGQQRIAALQAELKGTTAALKETESFTASLRQGFSQFAAAFGAFQIARGFIDANVKLETLRRSLTLLTGSTETAKAQIEFLRTTAGQAGLSFTGLAQDFTLFTAAANTSGMTLERQREVFAAVTNAAGQLGLSTDRTGLILQALTQTASKGKVTLEELQGQLGESLPGALAIVANGFDVTKAQLLELVKGGVDAEKFFEAFIAGSKQAFGEGAEQVEGFQQSWTRFKSSLAETAVFVGQDGGVLQALVRLLTGLSWVVRETSAGFEALGKLIGQTLGFISTFDFAHPIESLRRYKDAVIEMNDEIDARLDKANANIRDSVQKTAEVHDAASKKIGDANKGVAAAADQVAASQTKAGDATAAAGTAATAAAGSFGASASAQAGAAKAADSHAQSQTQAASATVAAGDAAKNSAAAWAQQELAYVRAKDAAEHALKAAEANAHAKKIEGEASVLMAKLTGNEVEAVNASLKAAESNRAALEQVAAARNAEAELIAGKIGRLQESIRLSGDESGALKKQADELGNLLTQKKGEAQASAEAAAASRQDVLAKQIAAETYRDNSKRLGEYRDAVDAATAVMRVAEDAYRNGQASVDLYRSAIENLVKAKALERDALADIEIRAKLRQQSIGIDLEMTRAQIGAETAYQRAAQITAESLGNSSDALERQINLKDLERKAILATNDAKIASAQADREAAVKALEELQRTEPLNTLKREEYELRIKNADAKIAEANAGKRTVDAIDAEIDAMRRRSQQAEIDAINRASAQAAEAERQRFIADGGRSAEQAAFMRKQGGPVDDSYKFTLRERLQRGDTFDESELPAIENALRVAKDNAKLAGIPGASSLSGMRDAEGWVITLQRVLERVKRTSGSSGATTGSSTSHTVTINLGGQTRIIKAASAEDAANLTALLSELNNAASRSGP